MQMIREKKKSQRLFLKGEVEGKLQERQGIGVQVKDLSSLFFLYHGYREENIDMQVGIVRRTC